MPHTYVVTSYHHPDQLRRLVGLINATSPTAEVVVHRSQGSPPVVAQDLGRCRVVLSDRPVRWGDDSHLMALLTTLRGLALDDDEWVSVVSEQCYPLRPLPEYEEHLLGSGADCFLEQSILANPHRESLLHRATTRAVRLPGSERAVVRRNLDRARRRVRFAVQAGRPGTPVYVSLPRRRSPFSPSLQPTMGSDWFVLRGAALRALLDPCNDAVLRYYRGTFSPSEGYVHTVLLNRADIVNDAEPLHFLKWAGRAHPEELELADLDAAMSSGAWWARKFTQDAVLDEVDRRRAQAPG